MYQNDWPESFSEHPQNATTQRSWETPSLVGDNGELGSKNFLVKLFLVKKV